MKTSVTLLLCLALLSPLVRGQERLPLHVTPVVQKSVSKGLDWLAKNQGQDGNYPNSQDGRQYPVAMTSLAGMAFLANGNTPSRGSYAENVHRAMLYVMDQAQPSGLLASSVEYSSMSMHGHGFALLFLASSYGMETDEKIRAKLKTIITNAVNLTAQAQSAYGGWTYVPGGGDEGSV